MIYNLERREYTVQKTTDNMVAQFPFLLSFCIFFLTGTSQILKGICVPVLLLLISF